MIYIVSLNPAIDYIMFVKNFQKDTINLSFKEELFCAGKGVNVSIMLSNLGFKSTVLGFISGFTGEELRCQVEKRGINTNFVKTEDGLTRISVKIRDSGALGNETDINAKGPIVSKNDIEKFFQSTNDIQSGDILVLSGSAPPNTPTSIYENILQNLQSKDVTVVVDSRKELLLSTLKFHPFLIKPNHHELGELFACEISGFDDAEFYAKKLQHLGAQNVLVSMGKQGALLVTDDERTITAQNAGGTVINSVGAGDSVVAGFVAGHLTTNHLEQAFKLSMAAGNATAFSLGIASKDAVYEVLPKIKTFHIL